MSVLHKPTVLVVDDEPDDQRGLELLLKNEVIVSLVHPQDVTEEHLAEADVVLVDYVLKQWPERDGMRTLSLRPSNGLALSSVLRAHSLRLRGRRSVAFALHSAHLQDLSGGLDPYSREHTLARVNGLEWVFPKVGPNGGVSLPQQIAALANGVSRIPHAWTSDREKSTQNVAIELLGLTGVESWFERAIEEIEDCHPPLHEFSIELAAGNPGMAFLRWVLHRILPYPCFLWDSHRLAARLGVTLESFDEVQSSIATQPGGLSDYRYRGILSGFSEARWWRAGVESYLWDITRGRAFDPDLTFDALEREIGPHIVRTSILQPLVCIDKNYRTIPRFYTSGDVVRIQPDDWPPYADSPLVPIDLAREEPSVRAAVVVDDQYKLD